MNNRLVTVLNAAQDAAQCVCFLFALGVLLSQVPYLGCATVLILAIIFMMLMPARLEAIYNRNRILAMAVMVVSTVGGILADAIPERVASGPSSGVFHMAYGATGLLLFLAVFDGGLFLLCRILGQNKAARDIANENE